MQHLITIDVQFEDINGVTTTLGYKNTESDFESSFTKLNEIIEPLQNMDPADISIGTFKVIIEPVDD